MTLRRIVFAFFAAQAALTAPSPFNRGIQSRNNGKTSVNQTTCDGKEFTYQQLAGYGFVPSIARDKFGDTLGGYGSSIAVDRKSWKKLKDGTYSGTIWAVPDRGWYAMLTRGVGIQGLTGNVGIRRVL